MCSPRGVFSSDVYFPFQNGLFVSVALCRNELKERVQREREELKARCILKKHVKKYKCNAHIFGCHNSQEKKGVIVAVRTRPSGSFAQNEIAIDPESNVRPRIPIHFL